MPIWPSHVWGLLAAVSLLVIGLLWRLVRAWRLARARRRLVAAITGASVESMRDMLVPDGGGGGGMLHVDYLLLTARCLLVIDVRDIPGNIFGGEQMTDWTVMSGAYRDTFRNPLHALYDRIAAVRALCPDVPVEGRVLFTARGKFPKGMPPLTLLVDSLQAQFSAEDARAARHATGALRDGWHRLVAASQQGQPAQKASFLRDLVRG
jgi:hypothetical protein